MLRIGPSVTLYFSLYLASPGCYFYPTFGPPSPPNLGCGGLMLRIGPSVPIFALVPSTPMLSMGGLTRMQHNEGLPYYSSCWGVYPMIRISGKM